MSLTNFGAAITNPQIRAQVSTGNPPALSNATEYFKNGKLEMLRSKLSEFKLMSDAMKQSIADGNNGSGTWVRFAPTVTNLKPLGDDPSVQNQITGVGAVEYEVTTNNYGMHRVFADRQHRLLHNPSDEYRKELPLVHMETLEEIVRNHLIVNSDKIYATDKKTLAQPTTIKDMTEDCTPDISEINAAALMLRTKRIPFFKKLGSRYRVLTSIGVRNDLNSDPLVISVMDFDQDASYITTPQNEKDVKLLHLSIGEYLKTYVSQPGAADLNGDKGTVYAHHTLMYGAEAFGIGMMRGMGNVIVKKANNYNLSDPLNRISETQGWKVDDFGVVILTKVIDYVSVPTIQQAFIMDTDQTMLIEADIAAGGTGVAPEIGSIF